MSEMSLSYHRFFVLAKGLAVRCLPVASGGGRRRLYLCLKSYVRVKLSRVVREWWRGGWWPHLNLYSSSFIRSISVSPLKNMPKSGLPSSIRYRALIKVCF